MRAKLKALNYVLSKLTLQWCLHGHFCGLWMERERQSAARILFASRCKQCTANVKTITRWSDIALSLEVAVQKGEEIMGTLLSYNVYFNKAAQVHWSSLKTQRCRGFPTHFFPLWTWLLQDLSCAATSNPLEPFYVWDEGLKPQHPLWVLSALGRNSPQMESLPGENCVEFHQRTQHLSSIATAVASDVEVFLVSHWEREGGTGALRS